MILSDVDEFIITPSLTAVLLALLLVNVHLLTIQQNVPIGMEAELSVQGFHIAFVFELFFG
jgi:hypothetical protein